VCFINSSRINFSHNQNNVLSTKSFCVQLRWLWRRRFNLFQWGRSQCCWWCQHWRLRDQPTSCWKIHYRKTVQCKRLVEHFFISIQVVCLFVFVKICNYTVLGEHCFFNQVFNPVFTFYWKLQQSNEPSVTAVCCVFNFYLTTSILYSSVLRVEIMNADFLLDRNLRL